MNLFINDTPVKFVTQDKPIDLSVFDSIIKSSSVVILSNLHGYVLIDDAETPQVQQLINQLVEQPLTNTRLLIRPKNYDEAMKSFMSLFTILHAAGGVVQKGKEILMMYRLGKWDFPKGKLEKEESFELAAVREVEEETGVKVELDKEIATTWHTYSFHKKKILKCTKWYAMECVDDCKMTPQIEEGIEKIEWYTKKSIDNALVDTYNSIRFVWESYTKLV